MNAYVKFYITGEMKVTFADGVETYPYTGSEICPKVEVTYSDEPLTEGSDYTVEYRDNIEPGIGVVRVIGNSLL